MSPPSSLLALSFVTEVSIRLPYENRSFLAHGG